MRFRDTASLLWGLDPRYIHTYTSLSLAGFPNLASQRIRPGGKQGVRCQVTVVSDALTRGGRGVRSTLCVLALQARSASEWVPRGPETKHSKRRTHLLALRAHMGDAPAPTSTKRKRVGPVRARNQALETPDSLARAACSYGGRASAYKLEAQASGSLEAPKQSDRNAGLTCSRCVLIWETRQRLQARSASEWVP